MKIILTGSSGLVGSSLAGYFRKKGEEVIALSRPTSNPSPATATISWDYQKKEINLPLLENCDCMIHLAGANIADKRWSVDYKNEIYHSRVDSTKFLSECLLQLNHPPKLFLCASAVGIYGANSPNEQIDETSSFADDFLAGVCKEWEKASETASLKGIRVVQLRFGTILSKKGGALAKMLPIFKLGLGGPLGTGQQMFSWIYIDEIPHVIQFFMDHTNLKGAFNVVAPQAVSNYEFTKIFGRVLHRPTVFPVPDFGIKILFGEMGETLLLNGAAVYPKRLLEAGYQFRYPDLEMALYSACYKI